MLVYHLCPNNFPGNDAKMFVNLITLVKQSQLLEHKFSTHGSLFISNILCMVCAGYNPSTGIGRVQASINKSCLTKK
jgi:hypothetical protein